jgi:hypothetical protein
MDGMVYMVLFTAIRLVLPFGLILLIGILLDKRHSSQAA